MIVNDLDFEVAITESARNRIHGGGKKIPVAKANASAAADATGGIFSETYVQALVSTQTSSFGAASLAVASAGSTSKG